MDKDYTIPVEGECGFTLKGPPQSLVDASLQVYARTGRYPNSEWLHNAAMAYRAELIRSLTNEETVIKALDAANAIIAQQTDEMAHLTRDRDIWKEVCGVNKQWAEVRPEGGKLRARIKELEGSSYCVFDGLTLPPIIRAALCPYGPLLDISWGNDACASFILKRDEAKSNAVTLWVDYEKQEDRECEGASRFTVDRRLPDDTFVTYYEGDDVEKAVEALKSAP